MRPISEGEEKKVALVVAAPAGFTRCVGLPCKVGRDEDDCAPGTTGEESRPLSKLWRWGGGHGDLAVDKDAEEEEGEEGLMG